MAKTETMIGVWYIPDNPPLHPAGWSVCEDTYTVRDGKIIDFDNAALGRFAEPDFESAKEFALSVGRRRGLPVRMEMMYHPEGEPDEYEYLYRPPSA
jgi:hypothetical protein